MAQLEKVITLTPKQGIDILNLQNGTILQTIQVDVGPIQREPLLIDNEHILIQKGERYCAIINLKSGQLKQQWSTPEQLKSMYLTHNKAYFFAGGVSGKIYIWHFTTGELIKTFTAHYKGVSQVITNEDDTVLISAGLDGTVYVWDMLTLLNVRELNNVNSSQRLKPIVEFSRHVMPITSIYACPNVTNGGKLYTTALDRTVVEYCIASKAVRQTWSVPAPILSFTINPTYTELYVGCTNNEIYSIPLYDKTYYPQLHQPISNSTLAQSSSAQLESTQSTASSSSTNNQYAVSSGSIYKDFENAGTSALFSSKTVFPSFIGHFDHVTSLAISLHATHLISTSLDGTAIIWSVASRQIIKQVKIHPKSKKSTGIGSCSLWIDTQAALRFTDDMLRKKQFPVLLRDLRVPLELTRDAQNVRFGTNCMTSIPILPQYSSSNSNFDINNDINDLHYQSHLCSLIDAENVLFAVRDDESTNKRARGDESMNMADGEDINKDAKKKGGNTHNKNNKFNKQSANDDDDDVNDQDHSTKLKLAEEENAKQREEIAELQAELKKWKATAAKLYKQGK